MLQDKKRGSVVVETCESLNGEELLRFNKSTYLSTTGPMGLVGLILMAIGFSVVPIRYYIFDDLPLFISNSNYLVRALISSIFASIGLFYLSFKAVLLIFYRKNGVYLMDGQIKVSILDFQTETIESVRDIFVDKHRNHEINFPDKLKSGWAVIVETHEGKKILIKSSWVFRNTKKDAEKLCALLRRLFESIDPIKV